MPVYVSFLRGINVGGHNQLPMAKLRSLYESRELEYVQSYLQSGNLVFRVADTNPSAVERLLEDAVASLAGKPIAVVVRRREELAEVIEKNPLRSQADLAPSRFAVCFLKQDPSAGALDRVNELAQGQPEEIRLCGRELYIHFPNGMGASKLPLARVDKALGTFTTARNWNTVTNLLRLAENVPATS